MLKIITFSLASNAEALNAIKFTVKVGYRVNGPSAGSPTETLLRLLLPLNDKVHLSSRSILKESCSPEYSPDHSIGSSDGRCVQRAGT